MKILSVSVTLFFFVALSLACRPRTDASFTKDAQLSDDASNLYADFDLSTSYESSGEVPGSFFAYLSRDGSKALFIADNSYELRLARQANASCSDCRGIFSDLDSSPSGIEIEIKSTLVSNHQGKMIIRKFPSEGIFYKEKFHFDRPFLTSSPLIDDTQVSLSESGQFAYVADLGMDWVLSKHPSATCDGCVGVFWDAIATPAGLKPTTILELRETGDVRTAKVVSFDGNRFFARVSVMYIPFDFIQGDKRLKAVLATNQHKGSFHVSSIEGGSPLGEGNFIRSSQLTAGTVSGSLQTRPRSTKLESYSNYGTSAAPSKWRRL